ncbi:TadE-like protein [Raineyella antarctica]|uniref:TadE-like protein n=1 Tax=Raineyella antarctica TaxID=1577474 RepID=A0A1G6HRY1_9ACTN|nr:TadE/TadG family type IV pilus assembly protein [Raineyella antarctica]SDB96990.1 TadE-like protein [Raineyella antarctica]
MRRDQRGNAAVEVVVLVPALMALVGLVVAGARVWSARATVDEAAHRAARTATVISDARTSAALGREAGLRNLADLSCRPSAVVVDATALSRPPGSPGEVTATASCTVALADLLLPGLPGRITITADAVSVADRYRGR